MLSHCFSRVKSAMMNLPVDNFIIRLFGQQNQQLNLRLLYIYKTAGVKSLISLVQKCYDEFHVRLLVTCYRIGINTSVRTSNISCV